MLKIFVILLIASSSIVLLHSCKKECSDPSDPKCENYSPCFGKTTVTANFTIEEEIGPLLIDTDTVFGNNFVRFSPIVEYDSLKWLIGTEIVSNKILKRRFFPENQWISVSLIVYKAPNKNCFPNDNGIDTLTKYFFSAPKDSLPIFGYYQGYNKEQPNDTFTIQTVRYDSLLGNLFDFRNLPKKATGVFSPTGLIFGGRAAYIKNNDGGVPSRFRLEASMVVRKGKLTVDYSYDNEQYNAWLEGRQEGSPLRVTKTFIGKKL